MTTAATPPASTETERLIKMMTEHHKVFLAMVMHKAGKPIARIANDLGITRQEFYRLAPTVERYGFAFGPKRTKKVADVVSEASP